MYAIFKELAFCDISITLCKTQEAVLGWHSYVSRQHQLWWHPDFVIQSVWTFDLVTKSQNACSD